jgi:hypothetical protein
MLVVGQSLYVAVGAKNVSTVLCYDIPDTGYSFTYRSQLVGASFSSGKHHFKTTIAHPFGLAFDGNQTFYVSNQDTNTVAQATAASGLATGAPASAYLAGQYPASAVFLQGTFVASQTGQLHGVSVAAQDVAASDGGLGVTLDPDGKVQNSVRDVAIANGILFVCDEPDKLINMYALSDGTYLGHNTAPSASIPDQLAAGPTHFAIHNGSLYVSAGPTLYCGPLPASPSAPLLQLVPVALTGAPAGEKIGGISFGPPASNAPAGTTATVYIPFQGGTGGPNGGSIYTFTLGATSTSFGNPAVLVTSGPDTFADTPEFVLYL